MNWFHALTMIFVVAKIAGPLSDWSWWLVLLPSLISIGIGTLILLGAAVAAWTSK